MKSRGIVQGYKGRFRPENPDKYLGNSNKIIFRSLVERKMMRYLDTSDDVIRWSSEELFIPYLSEVDGKIHKYYPDFYVEMYKEQEVKKYILEIKPRFQTEPPKNSRSKTYLIEVETYIINQCKWKAAEEFCQKNGLEFKILAC